MATQLLLRAIGNAIDRAGGRSPGREAVRAELAGTTGYSGPLGSVSFTPAGDARQQLVTIYQSGPGTGLTGGVGGIDWSFAAELSLPPQ